MSVKMKQNFRLFMRILLTLTFVLCVISDGQLTKTDIEEILGSYTLQRRSVAPTATNLRELEWSPKLENLAQKAANSCIYEHNYDGEYTDLGENIYRGFRNASASVMIFFLERELYNYENNTCSTNNGNNKYRFDTCGHYYQNVSPRISKIGCGRRRCGKYLLLFCEFDAGREWTVPYPTGPSCSNCPESAPWCYRNLCISQVRKKQLNSIETSCRIVCKNCGNLNKKNCSCECKNGTSGAFCERLDPMRSLSFNCSPCRAIGHECNIGRGVEDLSKKSCRCNCIPPYSGKNCDVYGYESRLKYTGCFPQKIAQVSFNSFPKRFVNSTNIIAACSDSCSFFGYELLALTDGNKCSCGTSTLEKENTVPENQCGLPCKNVKERDVTEFCGGKNGQVSVYQTHRSIQLKIHGEYISQGVYPIDPWNWDTNVWPALRLAAKNALNKLCTNVRCCNSTKNVLFCENQLEVLKKRSNDGYIYLTLQVSCVSGRRVDPVNVLKAINDEYGSINMELQKCCNVQIHRNITIAKLLHDNNLLYD